MQRTFVMFKPDALNRGLVGELVNRFERKGLKLIGMKMIRFDDALVKEHYAHLVDKPFFPGIVEYIERSPVIVSVWEGKGSVEVVRKICGVTNGRDANAGTIRGDYSMSIQSNLVHASDSVENAEEEVKRFFKDEELFNWERSDFNYLYSKDEV